MMPFARAHDIATYAMIAAGFVGLVGGGGLPQAAMLVGLAGLIASWFVDPARSAIGVRAQRVWTVVALVVGVSVLAWAATGGAMVAAGGMMLIALTIAKACTRQTARDYQQICTLAFLMLIAGSVTNVDLTYGLAFFAFVVAATWALTLLHLRSEIESCLATDAPRVLASRRVVDRRFFTETGSVSLAVFAFATLAFVFVPRVGLGAFVRSRNANRISGFSDGVRLGGHGRIKTDTRVIMRVKMDRGQAGVGPYYWRGVAFDEYSGGEWRRSAQAPMSRFDYETEDTMLLRIVAPRDDNSLAQEIWLEPLDSDVLFATGRPVQFRLPPTRYGSATERNDDVRHKHASALHYFAWSDVTGTRTIPSAGPVPAYLQLPRNITDRTRALAAQITAGLTEPEAKARAIATHLQRNYAYTVELVDPGALEPVDFFLFERKAGHCEYFASAFAVLARAAGVPTRNVNGFLGGEWNDYEGYLVVRAGDAHSWAEVWLADRGWQTFDATPSGPRAGPRAFDGLRQWLDTLQFQWTRWVVEYDLRSQLEVFRNVGAGLGGLRKALVRIVTPLAWGAGAALVVASGWWWMRRRSRKAKRPLTTIQRAYRDATRALTRHGFARDAGQTPAEAATAWTNRGGVAAKELTELTGILYRVTFGAHDSPELFTRASELARAIADQGSCESTFMNTSVK